MICYTIISLVYMLLCGVPVAPFDRLLIILAFVLLLEQISWLKACTLMLPYGSSSRLVSAVIDRSFVR